MDWFLFVPIVLIGLMVIVILVLQIVWKPESCDATEPRVITTTEARKENPPALPSPPPIPEVKNELQHNDLESVKKIQTMLGMMTSQTHTVNEITKSLRLIEQNVTQPECLGVPYLQYHLDMDKMSEYVMEFVEVLNTFHVDYYMAYGTVLGFVREKDYLAWDHDVDVCIRASDYFVMKNQVVPELFKRNFQLIQVMPITVCGFLFSEDSRSIPGGDIRTPKRYLLQKEGQLFDVFMQIWMPPVVNCTIEKRNISVNIPQDPEVYLEDVYGPNWNVPDPEDKTVINRYSPDETRLACAMPWIGGKYYQHIKKDETSQ